MKKFIVIRRKENRELYLYMSSSVDYHFELLPSKGEVDVLGGGMFEVDREERKILMYGESVDFGPAKAEDIREAIQSDNFPLGYANYTFSITHLPRVSPDRKDYQYIAIG